MRKIRIIDKNDPNYGKEFDGYLCFYDRLYGKKIDGKIQDLYCVKVEGENKYYLTHQVDVDYYEQQEDDEYRAKHGYGKCDEVRVLDYEEVSCMSDDFKNRDTHVIRDISYACGLVYFANDITCVRWPKVEVIKRAERKEVKMSTCRECKNIHYETLPDKTSDYWNPICLYYNFRTSMNHKACEHFDEAESHI